MCVCGESDDNAGVGSGGGVVAVSACMCGTRGSGVLSSTGDVLEMSVVVLLFAFQSMFISIWVSRLDIAEFPAASGGLLHWSDGISVVE